MISLRVNRRLSVYRSWNDDGWLAMIYKSFRDTHFVSIAVRPTCFEINKSISTTKITPNDSPLCQPRGRFMKRFGGDFQLYGWLRANLQSRWKSLTRRFMKRSPELSVCWLRSSNNCNNKIQRRALSRTCPFKRAIIAMNPEELFSLYFVVDNM